MKTTGLVSKTLHAPSTTKLYVWYTDWMPAIAMDAATAALKVKNLANALRAQAAYQTATVRTDKPDAPVAVGTQQTADVETFVSAASFGLDQVTPSKTFLRFGVALDVSSAPNLGSADIALEVALRQCGYLLPPWSGFVSATSTTALVIPVSGWLPALGAIKVAPTLVVTGFSGSQELRLTWRTATSSPSDPGSWDGTGFGSVITGNTETHLGELTLNVTDKMWVQVGLRVYLTAAGAPGQANVALTLGVRSSS